MHGTTTVFGVLWSRGVRRILLSSLVASLALATSAGATARAQDAGKAEGAAKSDAAPVLRLAAKTGDRLKFRRTRARTATCEALGRRGDDALTIDYEVEVTDVPADGGLAVRIVFGPATGHFTMGDGTRLEIDTTNGFPEVEDPSAMVGMRALALLAGATVSATLDDRGHVVAVEGVVEAAIKTFAGTPIESMAAELPDDEAQKEVQPYLPALPAADTGPGSTWNDEVALDFGARLDFDFEHRWTMGEPADGAVTMTAEVVHVPGSRVPDGQVNSGEGAVTETRRTADGFVTKRTLEAAFHGEGNFEVETKATETIERMPVKSPAKKTTEKGSEPE